MRRMRGSVLLVMRGAASVTPGKSKKSRGGSSANPGVGSGRLPLPSMVTTTAGPRVAIAMRLIAVVPAACAAPGAGSTPAAATTEPIPTTTTTTATSAMKATTGSRETRARERSGERRMIAIRNAAVRCLGCDRDVFGQGYRSDGAESTHHSAISPIGVSKREENLVTHRVNSCR